MLANNRPQQDTLSKKAINFRVVYSLNAGGRKQKMSVFVAVGNGAGKVGFAIGKTKDTPTAVSKGVHRASKNMMRIAMHHRRTIYHSITAKYCSTIARVMPAKKGSGMKCSNSARIFLECLGMKDISVKFYGSNNPINCIKALSKALRSISSPRDIAEKRGVPLGRVIQKSLSNRDQVDQKRISDE